MSSTQCEKREEFKQKATSVADSTSKAIRRIFQDAVSEWCTSEGGIRRSDLLAALEGMVVAFSSSMTSICSGFSRELEDILSEEMSEEKKSEVIKQVTAENDSTCEIMVNLNRRLCQSMLEGETVGVVTAVSDEDIMEIIKTAKEAADGNRVRRVVH